LTGQKTANLVAALVGVLAAWLRHYVTRRTVPRALSVRHQCCCQARPMVCERISVQNRRFRSNGAGGPKISGRRGRPSTNHSSSQISRRNGLWYGIKIWRDLSFVLS